MSQKTSLENGDPRGQNIPFITDTASAVRAAIVHTSWQPTWRLHILCVCGVSELDPSLSGSQELILMVTSILPVFSHKILLYDPSPTPQLGDLSLIGLIPPAVTPHSTKLPLKLYQASLMAPLGGSVLSRRS